MNLVGRLLGEKNTKTAADAMRTLCWLFMVFFALYLLLAVLGRQTFALKTTTGSYAEVILAQETLWQTSRSFTITPPDAVYVQTNAQNEIEPAVRIGLSLIGAVDAVPMIAAYWMLSRVFSNAGKGIPFSEKDRRYLLGYGLIQLFAVFLVPAAKLLICNVVNRFCEGSVSVFLGFGWWNRLVIAALFIAAAYLLCHGARERSRA